MMSSNNKRKMVTLSLSLILFLSYLLIPLFASPTTNHSCRPDQRDALLEFKNEFYIGQRPFYKKTEIPWRNNTDCCSWDGVSCDPKTGVVVTLDLEESSLNGPLRSNSSLFKLQHLQSLDLMMNNLQGVLPDSIDSLNYLKVLNLRGCGLIGKIPPSLGNLSYLTDLDLSVNGFTDELPSSLGKLNRLTELRIRENMLSGSFPHVLLNLNSLTAIDIGSNRFQGTLPSNMSSLSSLTSFDIGGNSFSGFIPSSLFMIPSLIDLYMARNNFNGFLEIENNTSSPSSELKSLFLGDNNINMPFPSFVSKLVGLTELNLAYMSPRSSSIFVDLSLFSNLTSLTKMDLSGNSLKISPTLEFSSSISELHLSSCSISEFPKFLQNQTDLSILEIPANQIQGQVPEWLWSLPQLGYLNISNNSFTGFEGSADVIQRSGKLYMLDISLNAFQDPFPLLPNSIRYLVASNNRFSGAIPITVCELGSLSTLVLSNNNFNGSIPRCFENLTTSLLSLQLRNNSLSGTFPEVSISVALQSLDVGHNRLSGRLPKSLANCTQLGFLNVEHNRFNDIFPSWLNLLPNLQMIVLRSNEFHGPISYPGAKLRIFDISGNRFSGVLPSDFFVGWTAMSTAGNIVETTQTSSLTMYYDYYQNSVALVNKGLMMELVWSGFKIYKVVDISGNKFEGGIPKSIGLLKEMVILNMSNNAFAGRIPQTMSNLSNLQSLDLSRNRLSGEIPRELGKLTFLARMNFSYNKLEGPIPQSSQFQSQDSSSFAENLGLCGVPLQQTCGRKEATKEEEDDEQVVSWIAAAIGYVPGVFCGLVVGHILASSSYKYDWFMRRIFRSST